MIMFGNSSKLIAGVGLAVPRLGNVRLRLHFLRRGTSGGKDKPIISQSEKAKEITLGTQQNQVIVAYQLIDASGKLVRASESKSETVSFSSNGLPTGFYSVILKTEQSVLTSKLIIQ